MCRCFPASTVLNTYAVTLTLQAAAGCLQNFDLVTAQRSAIGTGTSATGN